MTFRFDKPILVKSALVFGVLFCIDRLTKQWALVHALQERHVWGPLSFELAFNRGISWGMLHSSGFMLQGLLIALILFVLILFLKYTIDSYLAKKTIYPHMMIIAGATSNLWDRVWYPGVIDFIVVAAYRYQFPTFNCADASIVLGVMLLFLSESGFFTHE